MQKTAIIDQIIDCEDIPENAATFNFNTNTLKLGKVNLPRKQIDRIAFLLAADIESFAETNGNFSTLSANDLYFHLYHNQ